QSANVTFLAFLRHDLTQAFLPEPASLRDSLLLADRGHVDLHSLRRVQAENGCFLIRAKAGMTPQVVEAFREDGKCLQSLRNKRLKAVHAKLPKRQRVELGVQWQVDGYPLCLRLIISWHPRTKSFCYFLTNLPPQRYPLEVNGAHAARALCDTVRDLGDVFFA